MITDDPKHPDINQPGPNGQNKAYLVLSEEERAKGFVRPYRDRYVHVGKKPKNPLRDVTPEEQEKYAQFGWVKYESYPKSEGVLSGQYWTETDLKGGCGGVTTMGSALSETYARDPKFYGRTFCVHCGDHFPVAEFIWSADNEVVGS